MGLGRSPDSRPLTQLHVSCVGCAVCCWWLCCFRVEVDVLSRVAGCPAKARQQRQRVTALRAQEGGAAATGGTPAGGSSSGSVHDTVESGATHFLNKKRAAALQ